VAADLISEEGDSVKQEGDVIVVEKNRRRAIWALAIIVFMSLVSLALLGAGLLGGDGILWTPIALGTVGLLGFGVAAWMIVSTMRARWHLAVSRSGFRLHTPAYPLDVPWENVAGIATNEVNFREGCVLLFEDPAAVAQTARFLVRSNHPEVIATPDAHPGRHAGPFRGEHGQARLPPGHPRPHPGAGPRRAGQLALPGAKRRPVDGVATGQAVQLPSSGLWARAFREARISGCASSPNGRLHR